MTKERRHHIRRENHHGVLANELPKTGSQLTKRQHLRTIKRHQRPPQSTEANTTKTKATPQSNKQHVRALENYKFRSNPRTRPPRRAYSIQQPLTNRKPESTPRHFVGNYALTAVTPTPSHPRPFPPVFGGPGSAPKRRPRLAGTVMSAGRRRTSLHSFTKLGDEAVQKEEDALSDRFVPELGKRMQKRSRTPKNTTTPASRGHPVGAPTSAPNTGRNKLKRNSASKTATRAHFRISPENNHIGMTSEHKINPAILRNNTHPDV